MVQPEGLPACLQQVAPGQVQPPLGHAEGADRRGLRGDGRAQPGRRRRWGQRQIPVRRTHGAAVRGRRRP
eukprot:267966-Alexandrium_andersonii.AAC.1